MKIPAFIFCLFAITMTTAQTGGKPLATKKSATTDWDLLDEAFIAVVGALEKGDQASFTALSLPNLDCVDCVGATEVSGDGTAFVPSGFFYAVISKNFTGSPVYKAMVNKGYSFSTIILKNFRPKLVPRDGSADLKLYEVWVETYKKDEFAKGHTGTSHSFRFVKLNGKFRFYGLTSIP